MNWVWFQNHDYSVFKDLKLLNIHAWTTYDSFEFLIIRTWICISFWDFLQQKTIYLGYWIIKHDSPSCFLGNEIIFLPSEETDLKLTETNHTAARKSRKKKQIWIGNKNAHLHKKLPHSFILVKGKNNFTFYSAAI